MNKKKRKRKRKRVILYSVKALEDCHRLYEKNFELLMKNVGLPLHDRYIKEESRMNILEIKIRRNLGGKYKNALKDPCELKGNHFCEACTGWYKTIEGMGVRGFKTFNNQECERGDKDAKRCYFNTNVKRFATNIRNGYTMQIIKEMGRGRSSRHQLSE